MKWLVSDRAKKLTSESIILLDSPSPTFIMVHNFTCCKTHNLAQQKSSNKVISTNVCNRSFVWHRHKEHAIWPYARLFMPPPIGFNGACRRDGNFLVSIIICPIAIAYSMGHIIKSVWVCRSVCVSVRVSSLSRAHFFVDFHKNWTQKWKPPKVRTSSLGVNIAPPLQYFPPKKPHFDPEIL